MNKIKNGCKGFTLLELLVVVLIIGILAAVALPQYKLAVAKSKAAQMLSLVKSFADAEDRFYLVNGRYTYNYDDLDLVLPSTKTAPCRSKPAQTCYDINGWSFEIFRANQSGTPVSVEANKDPTIITSYFEESRRKTYGRLTCVARPIANEAFGHKICKALGGKKIMDKLTIIILIGKTLTNTPAQKRGDILV